MDCAHHRAVRLMKWQSLPQTASSWSVRREVTGSLDKVMCEARGKWAGYKKYDSGRYRAMAAWHCWALSKPCGMGFAAWEDVGCMCERARCGWSWRGDTKPCKNRPAVSLHWSPVRTSPYSGLRESTKRGMEGRKGEKKKLSLQYWVIYLDWQGWACNQGCWVLCCIPVFLMAVSHCWPLADKTARRWMGMSRFLLLEVFMGAGNIWSCCRLDALGQCWAPASFAGSAPKDTTCAIKLLHLFPAGTGCENSVPHMESAGPGVWQCQFTVPLQFTGGGKTWENSAE